MGFCAELMSEGLSSAVISMSSAIRFFRGLIKGTENAVRFAWRCVDFGCRTKK